MTIVKKETGKGNFTIEKKLLSPKGVMVLQLINTIPDIE